MSPQDLADLDAFLDLQWREQQDIIAAAEAAGEPDGPSTDEPAAADLSIYPEWHGVLCGHCHSYHATPAEVKECAP